ncbi:hypothetical protein QFZ31_001435 [Neobacillus niacini]|jgi:hypothetical protein|nr:hypothetical protein [Neobacillus niacini]MDQ0971557.1 hypothetical protein [Neobacillus niacini]
MNEGTGADVLGHPATCVAWLANKLADYDVTPEGRFGWFNYYYNSSKNL